MKLRQPARSGANSGRHVLEDEAGNSAERLSYEAFFVKTRGAI